MGPRVPIAPPQTRSATSTRIIGGGTVTIPPGKTAQQTITERHTTTATATPYKEPLIECFGEMVLVRVVTEITGQCTITTTTETVPDDPGDSPIPDEVSTETIPYQSDHSVGLAFNCTRFLWFEPRESDAFPPNLVHIFPLSSFLPAQTRTNLIKTWENPMQGRDDLVYTLHDDKRPDFSGQGNTIQSSGKYNWFFTLMPSPVDDWQSNTTVNINITCGCRYHAPLTFTFSLSLGRDMVLVSDVNGNANPVDILACYNRVPDYDLQVPKQDPRVSLNFSPSARGGKITFSNADSDIVDRLTQTEYVLVTWKESSKTRGAWCKIVFLDKDELSTIRKPTIVVIGDLPKTSVSDMQVYIANGILYHKRLKNVPFK